MKNLVINNELKATYLDSFHEMNSDELKKFFVSDQNRSGIYDENLHMIISVSWTKPGFLNYITDAKSVLKGTEYRMKNNMTNYRRLDSINCEIASKKAVGFRFEYLVGGTDIIQTGETYVFKQKNKYYAIHVISRKEGVGQCRQIAEDFLRSMTLLV